MLNRQQRISAAELSGIAAAYAQVKRLTRDQALAEIAEVLAPWPPDVQAEILADAASAYVDGDRHHDPAATELLTGAGADLDRARRIRAARTAQPDPLRIVADQANRAPRH